MYTLLQQSRNLANCFPSKGSLDRVTAHGQGQAASVFVPPLAEIQNLAQAECLIEELSFVNQQAGIATLFGAGVDDLVEGNDFVLEVRLIYADRENGAG